MCFTINVNILREEMERRFQVVFPEPRRYEPNYYLNAFSLPEAPVICSDMPHQVSLSRWGLVPWWVKDRKSADDMRRKTFNARAETIHLKASFKNPVRKRRCLVASRGFYEWQTRTDGKIPYYIYLEGHRIFSYAGIFDIWRDSLSGEEERTFSIITTRANPLLEKIHNLKKRMPVILHPQDEEKWLDTRLPLEEVLGMLEPFPENLMQAHTISKMITDRNAEKNSPAIIEPFLYPEAPLAG